jgi:zinc protease
VIAISFAFKNAGSHNDPLKKQGLAQLVSNTMDEGAADLDSETFQKILNDQAITLRYSAGRDHFTGNLKTLTKNKDTAFFAK